MDNEQLSIHLAAIRLHPSVFYNLPNTHIVRFVHRYSALLGYRNKIFT